MANVYGMTGGVSEAYSGQKSIRPTTVDIELDTKDKILESDLTIQGDSNLVGNNIKYGSNIFGVNGTGTPVNFHGGVGTAFRNGVSGLGDVVNEINNTDQKYVREIGEMELVSNKYPYLPTTNNETLIFRSGTDPNIYATLTLNIPNATVTFYNNLNKISTQTLTEVNTYASVGFHCATSLKEDAVYIVYASISTTDDPTGYRAYIHRVKYNSSIGRTRTTYNSERPSGLCVTDDYVMFCCWDRTENQLDIRGYTLDLSASFASSTAIPDGLGQSLQYYITCYGLDNRIYLVDPYIYQSERSWYSVYCYVPNTAQLVFVKKILWSDLAYSQTVYPQSDDISALLLFCDGVNGRIYYYYSNQPVGTSLYEGSHVSLATFDFNMASKLDDVLMGDGSFGLVNSNEYFTNMLDPNFYYDQETRTILYWTYSQAARLGLDKTIYSYATQMGSQVLVPCLLSDGTGQVDYCWDKHALEDASVTTAKTITTDTYTATIEEV